MTFRTAGAVRRDRGAPLPLKRVTDMPANSAIPHDKIVVFCRKWKVRELAVFGSVLRDDFGPESDIDFLVRFEPDASWDLWDLTEMREELTTLVGRPVDIVEREALRNPYRRREILSTCEVVYAA